MAYPCGHLDDLYTKLQVIKSVHIDVDQEILLQDTILGRDDVQMLG